MKVQNIFCYRLISTIFNNTMAAGVMYLLALLCICLPPATPATIEERGPTTLKQGERFTMSCQFDGVSPDQVLRFVRESAYFNDTNGYTALLTPKNITVDRLEMNPDLEALEENPYSVTLNEDDNTALYTLTITDVHSGNQGNISCVQIDTDGSEMYKKVVPLIVLGEVRSLDVKIGVDQDNLESWPEFYQFNTSHDIIYDVQLLVNYSSTVTDAEMYVEESGDLKQVTLNNTQTTHNGESYMIVYDTPMIYISYKKIYEYKLKPKGEYNNRNLVASVTNPLGGEPITMKLHMNVSFAPEVMRCEVVAPVGTEIAKVICHVNANPAPDRVTWYRGTPAKILEIAGRFTVENKISGDALTSTLTIADVVEEDYTYYYIWANNVNGNSGPPAASGIEVRLAASTSSCIRYSMLTLVLAVIAILARE